MPRRLAVLSSILAASLSAAQLRVWTFDSDRVGGPPAGFTFEALRQAQSGDWHVTRVGSRVALGHAPGADADGWSLALAPGDAPADARITARLRLSAGSRAGGLVWHYRDGRNFSAVVLDLEDGDLALFRVSDGNRIRLEDRDGLDLDPDGWHTITIVQDGARTRVSIGGIRVLDRVDRRRDDRDSLTGRVGLLAHGRAVVAFDDLKVEPEPGSHRR